MSARIETHDAKGNPNGWLLPIWNALENGNYRPDQIYLTVVEPNCAKGPHLHLKRTGLFCCIRGNVKIVTRKEFDKELRYDSAFSGSLHGFQRIIVSAGVAAQIVNVGVGQAYVLNLCSPAWSAEDPDEWPVEGWDP